MENTKVFAMKFARVYPCLLNKAERKGRQAEEVLAVTSWLTGYTAEQIQAACGPDSTVTYGDFFRNAPQMHPNRERITGSICGIRVELIEDPLMQEIRRLDKLVDELAKGKPMDKILRK